jgi:hypothetical protein
VFQFRGGVPAKYSARYVSQVIVDPSGPKVSCRRHDARLLAWQRLLTVSWPYRVPSVPGWQDLLLWPPGTGPASVEPWT